MVIYGFVVVMELINYCWMLFIVECEVFRIGCGQKLSSIRSIISNRMINSLCSDISGSFILVIWFFVLLK